MLKHSSKAYASNVQDQARDKNARARIQEQPQGEQNIGYGIKHMKTKAK